MTVQNVVPDRAQKIQPRLRERTELYWPTRVKSCAKMVDPSEIQLKQTIDFPTDFPIDVTSETEYLACATEKALAVLRARHLLNSLTSLLTEDSCFLNLWPNYVQNLIKGESVCPIKRSVVSPDDFSQLSLV